MEEKAFSPEISEDVIELLDIVDADASKAQDCSTASNSASGKGGDTDEEALELTEIVTEYSEADIVDLMDVEEMPQAETEAGPAADDALVEDEVESPPYTVSESEQVEQKPSEESAPAAQAVPAPISIPVPAVSPAEMEACFGLVAEVESRVRQIEEKYESALSALEVRLAASEQKCEELWAELEARLSLLEEKNASCEKAIEEQFAVSGQKLEEFKSEFCERMGRLEENTASAMQREEFTSELASLQQQIAESPSRLLEDDSMVIGLEEMIGRMLDSRLPAEVEAADSNIEDAFEYEDVSLGTEEHSVADAEEGDTAAESLVSENEAEADFLPQDDDIAGQDATEDILPSPACDPEGEASRQAIIETIDELARHVAELEERVADWEVRCEQEAALAAARVIREEIAALKAGAARMGR